MNPTRLAAAAAASVASLVLVAWPATAGQSDYIDPTPLRTKAAADAQRPATAAAPDSLDPSNLPPRPRADDPFPCYLTGHGTICPSSSQPESTHPGTGLGASPGNAQRVIRGQALTLALDPDGKGPRTVSPGLHKWF